MFYFDSERLGLPPVLLLLHVWQRLGKARFVWKQRGEHVEQKLWKAAAKSVQRRSFQFDVDGCFHSCFKPSFLSGQDVYKVLDNNVHVYTKESIYVKLERPSLNRGGGLWHYLSPTYSAVLSSLPDSLTSTWAHVALATHMKADWVNDS